MEIVKYFNYNSIVILTMFFISLVEIILDRLTGGLITKAFFASGRGSPINPMTYIKMFTHCLGHMDWGHFSRNYMKILLLGPIIEEKYGSVNLLIMILITSFVIALVNMLRGGNKIVGASGISFMLVVLSSIVNITDNRIPLTFILILIFYITDEIIDVIGSSRDGVSHLSHLVGAVCGGIFGFICVNQELSTYLLELKNKFINW